MQTENQPQTPTPVPPQNVTDHPSKNSKKVAKEEFTAKELDLCLNLINQRTKGTNLQALRQMQRLSEKIKAVLPPFPEQPKKPEPKEGEDKVTEEVQKQYAADMSAFLKETQTWPEQVVDIKFESQDIGIIRSKMNGFGGFHSDEESRTAVLELADKLGI